MLVNSIVNEAKQNAEKILYVKQARRHSFLYIVDYFVLLNTHNSYLFAFFRIILQKSFMEYSLYRDSTATFTQMRICGYFPFKQTIISYAGSYIYLFPRKRETWYLKETFQVRKSIMFFNVLLLSFTHIANSLLLN